MAADEERRKQAVQARVTRVQRHLNIEIFARAAIAPAWVMVTSIVVWRLFVPKGLLIFSLIAVVLGAVVTFLTGRTRSVTRQRAAVIADRQAGAGGLLLTRLELPVGQWELGLNQQLRALTLPPLDVRRAASLVALALCFLGVSFFVPPFRSNPLPPNAAASTRVEELADKMEAISKEEPTDEAAKEELQRLQDELADNSFDATDWEAADELEKRLDKAAAEASRELDRADQAAKNLESAMAEASENEGTKREEEELEKALMALSDGEAQTGDDAMEQALNGTSQGENGEQKNADEKSGEQQQQNGQQGQGEQQPQEQNGKQGDQQSGQQGDQQKQQQQGQQQQKKSGPSQSKVEQLRKALQQRQEQLAKKFDPSGSPSNQPGNEQQQAKAGPQKGKGKGQGKGEGEGEARSKGDKNQHVSRGFEQGEGTEEGGHEALVFGKEAEMDPDRLGFEALPKGNGGEAEDLLGMRAANPKNKPSTGLSPSQGNAANGDQTAGYDEGAMRPRNRALVQRYFDSK